MAQWLIQPTPDGKRVDVTRDGRAFAYDLDDVDEALTRIRRDRHFDRDDAVIVEDRTGYRERVRVR